MRDLDITPRMQKYSDSFNNYFQSMGDAIENWAKTGKFNSKELFNSLISDLARYEIKLAMTALYANAIRPLFNSALSFLGFGFQLPVGKAKGDVMMGGASLPGYAMGAVFDNGTVAKYAMGGIIEQSNTVKYASGGIVDQPTLFPMKKGMGLMGEAGPEAIMPLRKDSNGNLGVMTFARGGVLPVGRMPTGEMGINLSGNRSSRDSQPQYNHETVIHNYTGQQVTEQVSTNSRGGRRTEYFIGEAAAGETARNGGSMQNAIRNTYGLQPKLIRR
jgi:lambda family phage tail tape measure protein